MGSNQPRHSRHSASAARKKIRNRMICLLDTGPLVSALTRDEPRFMTRWQSTEHDRRPSLELAC
jgi:hypothetical protein